MPRDRRRRPPDDEYEDDEDEYEDDEDYEDEDYDDEEDGDYEDEEEDVEFPDEEGGCRHCGREVAPGHSLCRACRAGVIRRAEDARWFGYAPKTVLLAAGAVLGSLLVLIILMSVMSGAAGGGRLAGNERAAINGLQVINTALNQFREEHGKFGDWDDLVEQDFLAGEWAEGTRSGYTFVLRLRGGGNRYEVRAEPEEPGVSGRVYYYTDTSGVIRGSEEGRADDDSPPID